jgi:hypothetical protein
VPPPPAYPEWAKYDNCDQWDRWFNRIGAARVESPLFAISAPRTASVTITRIRVRLYRVVRPRLVTLIVCTPSGEGERAGNSFAYDVRRQGPSGVLETQRQLGLRMPPASLYVKAGTTEQLYVDINGHDNRLYEWGAQFDAVVDQRPQQLSFGSPTHPLRSLVSKRARMLPGYDYDARARRWFRSGS